MGVKALLHAVILLLAGGISVKVAYGCPPPTLCTLTLSQITNGTSPILQRRKFGPLHREFGHVWRRYATSYPNARSSRGRTAFLSFVPQTPAYD